ncbi:TAXI family TRAP transporter solute-binding subunit [Pseudodesulfovibrio sediminis]|uniref:TRAP transporter solute receptor, TAXI family n=1 Tax=Pseudodesulfovibrio sediminis TaxID=2810563 RepID=A0ABN6ESG7_9BACT|nr:TAXI family TRAP transporter solute-binding subunit [Pseudodesulfovibrio sediminis]BCS89307.1 hypothetical protein PSDVSF_25490 [Pseudodesulfovibrio sediminis]
MLKTLLKIFKSHQTMTLFIYGTALALLALSLWVAFQYVDPLPPTKVTIATGGPGGSYYDFAQQYADYFKKQGYELEVLETGGSTDNLALLSDPESTVQAALIQGGIAAPEDHPNLESLGSLYYEPIWLFQSARLDTATLPDLRGKTIAVGSEGSGTQHLVSALLAENDVTPDTATLKKIGAGEAIPQLLDRKIDALFTIGGVGSSSVGTLIRNEDVNLYSFTRAEAYTRTHHYMRKLVLPQGGIDLVENLPDHDITLLAPTANLVVKDDLHPSLKYLFLLAANEVHGKGDLFAAPGTFPNGDALLFPLSSEGENFYKSGPPFLMRYLPFQLAITIERLKILLIPLLTLLFPLFKITPPAYRWQIRRRIFKWYKHLKQLDTEAYEMTCKEDAQRMLDQLEEMDRMVLETSVPLSYTDYIYSLRLHIRMIQRRLERIMGETKEDTIT